MGRTRVKRAPPGCGGALGGNSANALSQKLPKVEEISYQILAKVVY